MSKINKSRLASMLFFFVLLMPYIKFVALPAVDAGMCLAYAGYQVQIYNGTERKTDEYTKSIELIMQAREDLKTDGNEVVAFMASHPSYVWIVTLVLIVLAPYGIWVEMMYRTRPARKYRTQRLVRFG